MRNTRENSRARIATGQTRPGRWAAVAIVSLSLSLLIDPTASASAHAVKRVCATVAPGRAACTAVRLLVGASGTATATGQARSASSTINESKPIAGFLTPERLHEAYELPDETAAGATQTIAVVDAFNDPTVEADLAVYDKQFGLAPCTSENGCFEKVNQEGNASPLPEDEGGWATEISIDVQMAHAICQNCHILLVETKGEELSQLGAGVNSAVKLGATEVSNSYAATERSSFTSLNKADFNHPGIVVAAASGDCGYLNKDCPKDPTGANFPADSPDVLAVGGTSMTESGGVWTSTAWEEGGSGCSTLFSAALWQAEVANFSATGCGAERAIADISAIGDPNTGVDIYDSTPEEPGAPTGWGVWGGTSVASPIVAAEFGLAGGSGGVAYPASTLYSHAGQPSALYDVLSGNNGTCASTTICRAVSGYDGPTGLGSPIGLEAFAPSGSPQNVSPPTIAGAPEQGETLTEHHGEWSGEPSSYAYQWERCNSAGSGCQTIASATENTYKPTASEVGSTIRVRETAKNSLGSASADSAVTSTVASDLPTISSFSPSSGITGSSLLLKGTALDTTSAVMLGKLAASFIVISPTELEVTVPSGASNGKIAVTTATGSVTSKAKFTVTLTIKSFKPTSAAAGIGVTIKGAGFTPSSTVSFDGTPAASVTYFSKSKLKAIVPAGAGAGPITVTNTAAPVGTVASPTDFTP